MESELTYLALVLAFKIVVTSVMVALPLLTLPGHRLQARFKIGADAVPLARLYGVAVTALLVGYASGFTPAQTGQFPWGVVFMGIVSNLGATLALAVTGRWRASVAAPIVFGGIAIALIASAVLPHLALVRVF